MAMEYILGKIPGNMLGNGLMENNTGKGYTDNLMVKKEREFGKMERELDG